MAGDIFDAIATATTFKKGNYFNGGAGLAVVKGISYKDLLDGPTFNAELEIKEIKDNGVRAHLENDPRTKKDLNPVGATFTYTQKVRKFPKNAPGNVKAFMCALWGVDEEDPNFANPTVENPIFGTKDDGSPRTFKEAFQEFCAPGQPGRGMLIRFDSYQQQTEAQQKAGTGAYNVYAKFSHVADQGTDEELAARRAALGG